MKKQFRVEEVVASKRYRYAGKLGPWARAWPRDVRYLATGSPRRPMYGRIKQAGKEGDSWRYVRVRLEGESDVRSCWCGTNTYREVSNEGSD